MIDQTSSNITSLREQCEKECKDVMEMHGMAVDMANNKKKSCDDADDDDAANNSGESGKNGSGGNSREEENVCNHQSELSDSKQPSAATSTNNNTNSTTATNSTTTTDTKPSSSTSNNSTTSIQISITAGPHTSSKYLLRPKPGVPCLLGRSKGKKFIKNGVSLHKDQEVSTTHGKFIIEGGGLSQHDKDDEEEGGGASGSGSASGGGGGGITKFYFIDVGSTNGTVYKGEPLEPNFRLELQPGMELKVGNSIMKIG